MMNKAAKIISIFSLSFQAYAGFSMPQNIYFGLFGGLGSSNAPKLIQNGSAYYSANNKGGTFYVEAMGSASTPSAGGLGGGQIGKEIPGQLQLSKDSHLTLATEFEGYYLYSNLVGHDIDNDTSRLDEHDFKISLPINNGLFFGNVIFKFKNDAFELFQPYVGLGLGGSYMKFSGASSEQTSPPEVGINHFNSNPNAYAGAFAVQPKVGFFHALDKHWSISAEYRFLYIADSNMTFGSTVYPSHIGTSNWNVFLGSQYINLGSIGFQYRV